MVSSNLRIEDLRDQISRAEIEKMRLDGVIQLRTSELESTRLALVNEGKRSGWLEVEWTEIKAELDNVSVSLRSFESESQLLKTELNNRIAQLIQIQQQNEQWQNKTQLLRDELNQRVAELEAQHAELNQKNEHSQWLKNEWDAAEFKIKVIKDMAEAIILSEMKISHELQAVYDSTSWRITKPLRLLSRFRKWFFRLITIVIIAILKIPSFIGSFLMRNLASIINRRAVLKKSLVNFIAQNPDINMKLRQVLINNGINVAQIKDIERFQLPNGGSENFESQQIINEFSTKKIPMSPDALRIFIKLKKNISMKTL